MDNFLIYVFVGVLLLMIAVKAIRRCLRNRSQRSVTYTPPPEFVATVIVPDPSVRLPSYSHINISQLQPHNMNAEMGRTQQRAQHEREENERPPVFHIAVDMPTPALITEEPPPQYEELFYNQDLKN